MRRYLNRLYLWSGWVAALFIAAICAVVFAQVMLNLIDRISTLTTGSAIGLTIPSYADFTGFFLAASSFFALAHTHREGGHIRVSLIIQNLPPRAQRAVEYWSLGLALLATAYFTYYMALLVIESFTYHDLSPGIIPVPIWIPQAAVLAGLAVLTIALADDFLSLLRGRKASYAGKGENLLEGEELPKAMALPEDRS
ncbi:MAG: C4-dicarboxylate ABC transporter permease [Hyphomicrobiales bacterium]|nr:MAG: C4-dicarboxylate ABC transporter permease [Hyphomicrobiales bacterium]